MTELERLQYLYNDAARQAAAKPWPRQMNWLSVSQRNLAEYMTKQKEKERE